MHLGLESPPEDWYVFDKLPAKSAVAGKHVRELHVENRVDKAQEKAVSEPIQKPEVTVHLRHQPRSDHHICLAGDDGLDQPVDLAGRIGVISVHHYIHVRFHTREYALHHEAFALAALKGDPGARLAGTLHRPVRGVVIEHIDLRLRQLGAELIHNLSDGDFFVITGDQDRNS